jgi:hypothetical protein
MIFERGCCKGSRSRSGDCSQPALRALSEIEPF